MACNLPRDFQQEDEVRPLSMLVKFFHTNNLPPDRLGFVPEGTVMLKQERAFPKL